MPISWLLDQKPRYTLKSGFRDGDREINDWTGTMVHYDKKLQRVWVAGWRLHHGFTGAVFAVAGGLLMVHDWKDRALWLRDPSKA
jgi:hypothetical protein